MGNENVRSIKSRIWRRIAVKTAVCALWAAGMLYVALREGQELAQSTYWWMLFAIVAVWIATTIRDVRLLRDESALRRAAIEEFDERNLLISYKASRLAVTAMACLLPFSSCSRSRMQAGRTSLTPWASRFAPSSSCTWRHGSMFPGSVSVVALVVPTPPCDVCRRGGVFTISVPRDLRRNGNG